MRCPVAISEGPVSVSERSHVASNDHWLHRGRMRFRSDCAMKATPITANMVKALREETGSTLMDCKRALQDADGDYEAAKRSLLKPPDAPEEPEPEPVE